VVDRLRATININFATSDIADHVLRAISPDNTPLPEGLDIDIVSNDTELRIIIDTSRTLDSFRGTIEDIMSAIDLSLRTLLLVKK
jgi:hypothetical protein